MKKKFILLTLPLFIIAFFCQAESNPTLSKDYYLQKSKRQKKTAWILLGSGAGIAAIGGISYLIAYNQSDFLPSNSTGIWVAIAGAGIALSSSVFFVNASENARKAATITLNNQPVLLSPQRSVVIAYQPTVSLKINF